MAIYALDVVFDPDAAAADSASPIAMAFGWACQDGSGNWNGQGQRPNAGPEKVSVGDTVGFSIFSTNSSVTVATSVSISFQRERGNSGNKTSPFGASAYPHSNVSLSPSGVCAGCNIRGPGATVESLQVVNRGKFECTVEVTANGKTYKVDPELEVQQGGP